MNKIFLFETTLVTIDTTVKIVRLILKYSIMTLRP